MTNQIRMSNDRMKTEDSPRRHGELGEENREGAKTRRFRKEWKCKVISSRGLCVFAPLRFSSLCELYSGLFTAETQRTRRRFVGWAYSPTIASHRANKRWASTP